MPLIEKDKDGTPIIVDLSDDEKKTWREQYGSIRRAEQLPPAEYIDLAVEKLGGYGNLKSAKDRTTDLIFAIREAAWTLYTQHEQMVYGLAMQDLLANNPDTRHVLEEVVAREGEARIREASGNNLLDILAGLVGEVSGRIFPYPYELAKSITQSRRSRAGTAFERIIRHVINIFEFPCDDQSKIARVNFTQGNLGKIVDSLIPGIDAYEQNRSKAVSFSAFLSSSFFLLADRLVFRTSPFISCRTIFLGSISPASQRLTVRADTPSCSARFSGLRPVWSRRVK